ncbi:MAG: hypothetical protein ACE14T_08375 [Syntrophales bacterium]
MKNKISLVVAVMSVFLVTLCFSDSAFSQATTPLTQDETSQWTMGTPLAVDQQPLTSVSITTITGKVTRIENMPGVKDGEQMRVKTAQGENWIVFLGPRWFVDNQRLKFNTGDDVEVRGAKATFRGSYALIAADVSKGDMMMKLRNESSGLPSWECCMPRKTRTEE